MPSILKSPLTIDLRSRLVTFIPKLLKPTLKIVPYSVQKSILLPALHSVFKEAIVDGDFAFLQDKWLRISISDLDLNWWLSFDINKLIMASAQENIIEDVCFTASGDDLILIAGRKQDPDTLFFQRRLKIEGDTELGLEVKNLIDAIDIDQLPSTVHKMVDASASFLEKTYQQRQSKHNS